MTIAADVCQWSEHCLQTFQEIDNNANICYKSEHQQSSATFHWSHPSQPPPQAASCSWLMVFPVECKLVRELNLTIVNFSTAPHCSEALPVWTAIVTALVQNKFCTAGVTYF